MAWKGYVDGTKFLDTESTSSDHIVTDCDLELSVGSAGRFTFTLAPSNTVYSSVKKIASYVTLYKDNVLYFSGRVLSVKMIFSTLKKVTCEGLLSILLDSIFRPITHTGTLHELVQAIITSHNQQVEARKQIYVGTIQVSDRSAYRAYENYESSLSRLLDLQNSYGGRMQIRDVNGVYYFDWLTSYKLSNQTITLGSNLIDLIQTDDSANIITVLIPLGAVQDDGKRLTIKDVNSGNDYLLAPSSVIAEYGYILGVQIWDDVNTPSYLKNKGQTFIHDACRPKRSHLMETKLLTAICLPTHLPSG